MKTYLKRLMLLLTAVGFLVLIGAGCQASKGLGRDVEKLGENMQK